MTYADDYSLRTTNVTANLIANAIDGLLTRDWGGTTTGSANAYALSTSPSFTSLATGQMIACVIHANNTGNSTLTINGTIGPKTIKFAGQDCVGGELGQTIHVFRYDGTYLQLLNHAGRFGTWSPSYGAVGTGTPTYSSVTTTKASHQRHGSTDLLYLFASGTTGGTTVNGLTFSLPISAANYTSVTLAASVYDGGATRISGVVELTSASTAMVRKYDGSNFGIGATRQIMVMGFLEV